MRSEGSTAGAFCFSRRNVSCYEGTRGHVFIVRISCSYQSGWKFVCSWRLVSEHDTNRVSQSLGIPALFQLRPIIRPRKPRLKMQLRSPIVSSATLGFCMLKSRERVRFSEPRHRGARALIGSTPFPIHSAICKMVRVCNMPNDSFTRTRTLYFAVGWRCTQCSIDRCIYNTSQFHGSQGPDA